MRAFNVLFNACRVFKRGSRSIQNARETCNDACDDSAPPRPRRFPEYLLNLADNLPWFGEEPFTAATEPTPPRPAHRSPEYVRRVLLSFLAGRPVEVAAGRAGCSPRLMYAIINRVIYDEWPEKLYELWLYLGLIAIVEFEEGRPEPGDGPIGTLGRVAYEDEALLFCLVCHRLLTSVEYQPSTIPQMLETGALITAIVDHLFLGHVQGHLAVHFRLEDGAVAPMTDPWELAGASLGDIFGSSGGSKNPKLRRLVHRKKREKKRVVDEDALAVLRRHNRSDGENLLPLKGAVSMIPEEARRHWRSMIPNPGRRWKKKRRRRKRRRPT